VNDLETQYWAALESQGSHRSQVIATHANATAQASLCEVCYSHIDQVAPPEELSSPRPGHWASRCTGVLLRANQVRL